MREKKYGFNSHPSYNDTPVYITSKHCFIYIHTFYYISFVIYSKSLHLLTFQTPIIYKPFYK